MLAFIMRHGEAVPRAETDAERSLTPAGRDDVKNMVMRCREELSQVAQIWASPYLRTQETAAIVAEELGKTVETQPWLTPTDNPDTVLAALNGLAATTLLISHQPLVGTLIDRLGGFEAGRYRMGTSAIACLEAEVMTYGCADLLWLHQPE